MPSRVYYGTIGRIYMEKIDATAPSSECDRCRTRTAVYEIHWFDNSAPVRGLCQHCADAELTTYEFDMARGIGRERERITEAELNSSAEELTRLAEWYDGYYEQFVPPPFVAAFIARHYRAPDWRELIAGGIAPNATDGDDRIDPTDLDAARLALLLLRARLSNRGEVRADACVIRSPDRLLARDVAARILAVLPKPIRCKGVLWHGHMGVEPTPIARNERDARLQIREDAAELQRQHGPNYRELPMYCSGAGESLVIPVAAFETLRRDYALSPYGYGIHTLESHAICDPAGAREARRVGAIQVLSSGNASHAARESGDVIPLHDHSWEATSVLERRSIDAVCQCDSPSHWVLTDTNTSPWSETPYCDQCAARLVADFAGTDAFEQWIATRRRDVSLSAEESRLALDSLLQPWRHLPMSPALAELARRAQALL